MEMHTKFIKAVAIFVAICHTTLSCSATEQKSAKSEDGYCGPRCVQFILNYYNHDVGLLELIDRITPEHEWRGMSVAEIIALFQQYDVPARAVKSSSVDDLSPVLPVIAHLHDAETGREHFVVVLGTQEDSVCVWDGLIGVQDTKIELFDINNSRIAILPILSESSKKAFSSKPKVSMGWKLLTFLPGVFGGVLLMLYFRFKAQSFVSDRPVAATCLRFFNR